MRGYGPGFCQWILDLLLWIVLYPSMTLHKVLEAIFGSPAKIRILRVLRMQNDSLNG